MKILNLLLITALVFISSFQLLAQDAAPVPEVDPIGTESASEAEEEESKDFALSGMVDAYYQANLINGDATDDPLAFPTSFTDQTNQFAIGMVSLLATKEVGKVSFVGQVGFGPRAVAANSDSNVGDALTGNFASTVQQLFVAYAPSDAVTISMGNFGTFVGYEVIDAAANVNYSTSYLFSNGPFYHTGLKADFAIAEGFGAMLGVFNDTDSKIDAISGMHYGAQLSAEIGGLSAYLNFLTGKDAEGGDRDETSDDLFETQLDLTATLQVSETFALGLNASDYSTSLDGVDMGGFFGTALYGTLSLSEGFDLGLRGEIFSLTAADGDEADQPNVLALTASGNITVGDLRIIPEFRFDTGSNGFVFGETADDNAAASFILAGVYSF